MNPTVLRSTDSGYPACLRERLGDHAPKTLTTLGNLGSLSQPVTSLFCSVRCPGDAIVGAYDTARKLRDEGVTVISGFQSPVEKECLRILLRGKQPIIICLARALEKIRLPATWRVALDGGRLLILSPFEKRPRRPTVESARQRNELVAVLSNKVLIIHATPGGQIEQLSKLVDRWGIPNTNLRGPMPIRKDPGRKAGADHFDFNEALSIEPVYDPPERFQNSRPPSEETRCCLLGALRIS